MRNRQRHRAEPLNVSLNFDLNFQSGKASINNNLGVGDARLLGEVTVTSGTPTGDFLTSDVGKYLVIKDVWYQVTAVTGGVTLDGTPPDGTYTDVPLGSDNSPTFTTSLKPGTTFNHTPGNYMFSSQIITPGMVELIAEEGTQFWYNTHTDLSTYVPNWRNYDNVTPYLFYGANLSEFTFNNITIKNIGQIEADLTGGNDVWDNTGYYDTLNDVPATYSRRQNKRINRGGLFYGLQCSNVFIENCSTIETGLCLPSGPGSNWSVFNNTLDGWGEVGAYVPNNSTIRGNTFNQTSPYMNQADITLDVGTSHSIYITTGFDNVTISDNEFNDVRTNGIQWNTSTTNRYLNNLSTRNTFNRCYRVHWFGGGPGGVFRAFQDTANNCHHLGQVQGNALQAHEVTIEECTYDGNIGQGTGVGLTAAFSKSLHILGCTFSNRNEFSNDAGIRLPGEKMGEVIVDGCTFIDNSNSILFTNPEVAPDSLENITVKNCTANDSTMKIGDSAGADDKGWGDVITIDNNDFTITDVTQGCTLNYGATLTNNTFNCADSKGILVVNSILNTEAVIDGNEWKGSGLGISAINSNGNYSMLNNTSDGPTWNQGANPPNRDTNNIGF